MIEVHRAVAAHEEDLVGVERDVVAAEGHPNRLVVAADAGVGVAEEDGASGRLAVVGVSEVLFEPIAVPQRLNLGAGVRGEPTAGAHRASHFVDELEERALGLAADFGELGDGNGFVAQGRRERLAKGRGREGRCVVFGGGGLDGGQLA